MNRKKIINFNIVFIRANLFSNHFFIQMKRYFNCAQTTSQPLCVTTSQQPLFLSIFSQESDRRAARPTKKCISKLYFSHSPPLPLYYKSACIRLHTDTHEFYSLKKNVYIDPFLIIIITASSTCVRVWNFIISLQGHRINKEKKNTFHGIYQIYARADRKLYSSYVSCFVIDSTKNVGFYICGA